MKDYTAAIEGRISRRTYLETDIRPEMITALQEKIDEINAESGLHITWLADGAAALAGGKSYGLFRGVRALLVLKGDAGLPHLREKVGYYGEMLILEATALGLGTCWVGGTFDAKLLSVPEGEELVCVVPIGHVSKEATLKEKLMRGVIHRKSKTIEQLLQTDEPMSDELRRAMELVQRAPTARNLQKATFRLKDGEITAHVPEDYHLDLVDLGICKLHLQCGLGGTFEWGNGGRLCRAKQSGEEG